MENSLKRQFFYTPPAAAGPKLDEPRFSGSGEGPLDNNLWGSVTPATTAGCARSSKR